MIALSVPWPLPVAPSEPNSSVAIRLISCWRQFIAKRRAAFIGPTVCELDGPMPIRNSSSELTNTREIYAMVWGLRWEFLAREACSRLRASVPGG